MGIENSRSEMRALKKEIVIASAEELIDSVEKRNRVWEKSIKELELQMDQLDLAEDYLRQVEIDEKVFQEINKRIRRLQVEIVERTIELMNRAELRSA